MPIKPLALTRSLLIAAKFPLVALLCLFAAAATLAPQAMAGQAPVVIPDSSGSGLGDTFAPMPPAVEPASLSADAATTIVPARISRGVVNILRTIRIEEEVGSITGEMLPISSQQVSIISAVIAANGSEVEPAISVLEPQLSEELGGIEINVSRLGSSVGNLSSAIAATNDFIMSLNSEQLAAAIESPTFMAMLGALGGAQRASVDGSNDLALVEGGAGFSILSIGFL